jgi:hypothetical protein
LGKYDLKVNALPKGRAIYLSSEVFLQLGKYDVKVNAFPKGSAIYLSSFDIS